LDAFPTAHFNDFYRVGGAIPLADVTVRADYGFDIQPKFFSRAEIDDIAVSDFVDYFAARIWWKGWFHKGVLGGCWLSEYV